MCLGVFFRRHLLCHTHKNRSGKGTGILQKKPRHRECKCTLFTSVSHNRPPDGCWRRLPMKSVSHSYHDEGPDQGLILRFGSRLVAQFALLAARSSTFHGLSPRNAPDRGNLFMNNSCQSC
ncbi:hypothetical protein C3B79_1607 [Aeromonas hydrophila]|nr:hypothetical protein C3B79_1607 [Aeromonas hydrophila]